MDSGIRTLGTVGKLARISLIAYMVTVLLALIIQTGVVYLMPSYFYSNAGLFALVGAVVGILQVITFVASIILVAVWVAQAHRNLHEAGLQSLNYSPGWATASFFIPFINLWVPFASTRELFNRSVGKAEWHADTSAGDVTSWYACSWAAFIMFCGLTGVLAINSIPGVFVLMPPLAQAGLYLLLGLFLIGSAWFLSQVIAKVTRAQTNMEHVSQSDVFD